MQEKDGEQESKGTVLKNPYEAAKKMFTEAKSGTLKCTKLELDEHIKVTYSDAKLQKKARQKVPLVTHTKCISTVKILDTNCFSCFVNCGRKEKL